MFPQRKFNQPKRVGQATSDCSSISHFVLPEGWNNGLSQAVQEQVLQVVKNINAQVDQLKTTCNERQKLIEQRNKLQAEVKNLETQKQQIDVSKNTINAAISSYSSNLRA